MAEQKPRRVPVEDDDVDTPEEEPDKDRETEEAQDD